MKKQLLSVSFFLALTNLSFGQVNLEKSYVTGTSGTGHLLTFKKSDNSLFYFTFNSSTNEISIYDDKHLFVKKFTAPITGYSLGGIEIISDHLINSDNSTEFVCSIYGDNQKKVMIFNDEGNILHTFNDKYIVHLDKTASNSYKLILSDSFNPSTEIPYYHKKIDVYSLTGTLSSAQEEIYNNFKSFAYPNPATETLTIPVSNVSSDYIAVEVYDLSGKKVISEKVKSFNNEVHLNVSSLSKGNYLYKVEGNTKKFIKN